MDQLKKEIKNCTICQEHLPLGPHPIFNFSLNSKIAIIGQAPGKRVHESGIPWDDKSGDRLREWLGVSKEEFYNPDLFAIIPMGFCYPGTSTSGDLPPRPECAPQWHLSILKMLTEIKLTLLFGQYAQQYYLGDQAKPTLTETVRNWEAYQPKYMPMPHPSPRNNIWLKKNPWFEQTLIPKLQNSVHSI